MTYGCNNRKPIQTFGATTCQYTLSEIGKMDKKCEGCKESGSNPASHEQWLAFGEQCREASIAIGDAIDRHVDSVKLRQDSMPWPYGKDPKLGEYLLAGGGDKGNKWSDCA